MENNTYCSFIVPSGKYYLGDPCYVIKDRDHWLGYLKNCYKDNAKLFGKGNYEDIPGTPYKALALSTVFGDGEYIDNFENRYEVDSGLIGLVPFEYDPTLDRKDLQVVEFTEDVLCASKDGILSFGPYIIDTVQNEYE